MHGINHLTNQIHGAAPSWETKRFADSQESPRILLNQWFITAFTRTHHLSLFCARSSKSMSLHPTSRRSNFNIILLTTSRSSKWLFSLRFTHQPHVCNSPFLRKFYIFPLPPSRNSNQTHLLIVLQIVFNYSLNFSANIVHALSDQLHNLITTVIGKITSSSPLCNREVTFLVCFTHVSKLQNELVSNYLL